METRYVHGYSAREANRLVDQAATLSSLLHDGIRYDPARRVLEVGCGTGAQTVFLAANSPGAQITSIDVSENSVEQARARITNTGYTNVSFRVADLFNAPFAEASFDDLFVCFVLEHLHEPVTALKRLQAFVRPGGSITVIEGDHGSWYCHPQSKEASRLVQCMIDLQVRAGGDPLIGRRLYPLMREAELEDVRVIPRMVYVDSSRPDLVQGFSKNTFIAMVKGVREEALAFELVDEPTWEKGIADLYRATDVDGTFCYTFFRGTAIRRET